MNNLFENNGAEFSEDRKYRYCLWRIWDETKPMVMFIGLNPSVANELSDDPTMRRVINFSRSWGYGGVYMTNLFAWVTSYRKELKLCKDPIGSVNNWWLNHTATKSQIIIFAWGGFPLAKERGEQVCSIMKGYALEINKDGSPKHPLYIKGDTMPILYNVDYPKILFYSDIYQIHTQLI